LRPEFAAWRYGDQFGRRRRRQLLIAGGGVAALGALVVGGAVAGAGIGGVGYGLARLGRIIVHGNPQQVVAKIPTDTGTVLHVRRRHLAETSLARSDDGQLVIDLRFKNGRRRFVGRDAQRIAGMVIPRVNRFGANRQGIADAVREIEQVGGAEGYIERIAQTSHVYTRPKEGTRSRWGRSSWDNASYGLFGLPPARRLALEMALHEEGERRALDGELAELERAWRDAEEIAAIADDMFVPPSVTATIDRLRAR
jgi:hypothetical protein